MATTANTTSLARYDTARHVSLIYLIIIGIVGIFSNSLVVAVFVKHEKLRTAANLFILNLAVCDLIISTMDSAFSIPSTFYKRWVFSRAACVFYGFVHYFFISITVSTLAAISIDRFFYITKPAQVRTWRITRTRALGMLSVIYIYVLLFTFPPLTGWNSFVTEEYFYSGCYINYSDQDPAAIGYSVIASTFLFLAPLIVMVVSYHKIYTAVRTSTRKTISRALGPPGTPATLRRKYPLLKRTHIQTAKMIIVVIFFCVIVWLPYVVVSLIKAFTGNSVVSPLGSHITILITKSCVVYNVLIYVFLNRKLKSSIILLICCGKIPKWMRKGSKTSISKMRISRVLSETDKELPSDVIRNRLSAIAAFERGNDSGNSFDASTPVIRHDKGIINAGISASPPSSLLRNGKAKRVDSHKDLQQSLSLDSKAVSFDVETMGGANPSNEESGKGISTSMSLSQMHSDGSQNNILSFAALEGQKPTLSKNQHPGLVNAEGHDVTRVEARRRALRKINHRDAGSRKLPSLPKSAPTKGESIVQNNNNKIHNEAITPISILHSRENSSSTAFPSSNNSTMSETSLTSVKDDSSVDVSPRAACVAPVAQRNFSKKSKTISYRGGRNALLRERLRHSSKDPLHVSPSELQEIRTYWKRMSLCLDEINIDEEV